MDKFMRKCAMDRRIVQLLSLKTSFNKISKELKVSKKRIRQIQDMAREYGYLDGKELPPFPEAIFKYPDKVVNREISDPDTLLLEHKDWIKERRGVGWHLVTIWEELPVKVSRTSFYRFINRHGINEEDGRTRIKVVSEILYGPGEALILDWGKLRDVTDPVTGQKRTVWFLAGIMGMSRYMAVRLVWDNKTETTLKAIESIMNELGGVPKKIISDNPKCFSLEASQYEPLLNPAFVRFCEHYNIIPEILPPYSPEKKGKVERMVPYVRRLFEAYGEWMGLEDAQEYMNKKTDLANHRTHGTTKLKPIDSFLIHEASSLQNLPSVAFEREEYHLGKVRMDGHVRFRGKYYSVGKENCSKEVFIIGSSETVKIYFKGKLIETHPRITSSYQSKSTKKKHLEPHEQIMENNDYYINRASKIGTYAESFIRAILGNGNGFIDFRKIWGILGLDKKYTSQEIDQACKSCLECEDLSYRAVQGFLKNIPSNKNNIPKSTNNKFTRNPSDYAGYVH